jgi:hypothetical protein
MGCTTQIHCGFTRLLIFAAALCFTIAGSFGCHRAERASATRVERTNSIQASLIHGQLTPSQQWNLGTTVDAYKQVGQRNPRWDKDAVEALTTFALSRGANFKTMAEMTNCLSSIAEACRRAKSQGCTDPLIEHLFIRFAVMDQYGNSRYAPTEFLRTTQPLMRSRYPAVRKFNACVQTIQRYHQLRQPGLVMPNILSNTCSYLAETLADSALPEIAAYSFCDEFIEACGLAKEEVLKYWPIIQPGVRKRLGEGPRYHELEGHAYYCAAWDARGTSWAPKVRPEQWDLMYKRLKIARAKLEKAWQQDPTSWRCANLMLGLLLLDRNSRDEVELWFDRAMKNNTNNFLACQSKFEILMPKWGGSVDEMLKFGWQCATNKNWGGSIPMLLPRAHYEARVELFPEDGSQYFRRPGVWEEGKVAFEELLRRDSNNSEYREEYSRWTLLCRGRDEANRLFAR